MSKVGLTNYELNQQAYMNIPALTQEEVQSNIHSLDCGMAINFKHKYYMLLCRERNDYTIIHLNQIDTYTAAREVIEVLETRGEILDIDFVALDNYYQCWVRERRTEAINDLEQNLSYKWTPQVWMFALFIADDFVVEVGD